MSATALKSTNRRFSSLKCQNFEICCLVPRSPTHTGLICEKTPKQNISSLGPFKLSYPLRKLSYPRVQFHPWNNAFHSTSLSITLSTKLQIFHENPNKTHAKNISHCQWNKVFLAWLSEWNVGWSRKWLFLLTLNS